MSQEVRRVRLVKFLYESLKSKRPEYVFDTWVHIPFVFPGMMVAVGAVPELVQEVSFCPHRQVFEVLTGQEIVEPDADIDEAVDSFLKRGWKKIKVESLYVRLDDCIIHPGEEAEMEERIAKELSEMRGSLDDDESGEFWKKEHDKLYGGDDLEVSDE